MIIFKSKKFKEIESKLEQEKERLKSLNETIESLIKENSDLSDELMFCKKELTKSLTNYIEESTVDIDKFMTSTYKDMFNSILLQNSFSDVELKDKYNLLLNQEKVYLDACIDILNYCKYDKNRSCSIEKQLEKKFLTNCGLSYLNYIREMDENDASRE